jgi:peroxiredoxin
MTIKVGDKLPSGELSEYIEEETPGCVIGPNKFKVDDLTRGKKVVLFGLPGAFTPTCSAKHVPSYVQNLDRLKAKGVSEVICMAVNDAFVMGAWARDQKTSGKIRMMGDGSADFTKATRPRGRSFRARPGASLPTLLDARRQWRRQDAQHRKARPVRSLRCGDDAAANGLAAPLASARYLSFATIPSSCARLE